MTGRNTCRLLGGLVLLATMGCSVLPPPDPLTAVEFMDGDSTRSCILKGAVSGEGSDRSQAELAIRQDASRHDANGVVITDDSPGAQGEGVKLEGRAYLCPDDQ